MSLKSLKRRLERLEASRASPKRLEEMTDDGLARVATGNPHIRASEVSEEELCRIAGRTEERPTDSKERMTK